MTEAKKGLTRRRFLEGVGLAGGSVALYETMTALGLINLPEVWAGPPQLPQGSGAGKTVVILGAGIGGLTAAYELNPSYDYFTKNGTLTGVYNYDKDALAFGYMSLEQRIETARKGAIKFHPEFADTRLVPSDKAISIAWQNIPNEGGGWANWDPNSEDHAKAYARLLAPDRRFFVVGDQVSQLPGCQEGAMMSAQHVVEQIGGRRLLTVPKIRRAPNTRRLIHGRI